MSDITFASRRSPVYGRRGIVAAAQPLAVAAGLEILAAGGNAADAAVATAAALNVTEPTSTGIGGDCFALFFDAPTGQVTALNGSGRAPAALTLARLAQEGFGRELPPYHPYTITVPGASAGWCDLVERHGHLPLSRTLAPAIRLAERASRSRRSRAYFSQHGAERQLSQSPGGRDADHRWPQRRAPREVFRNPGLARTLRAVTEGGRSAFYEGVIAEAIAATVQRAGGCLTVADLASHRSTWDEPISTTYRDLRVWECPPNGQGLAASAGAEPARRLRLWPNSTRFPRRRLHLEIEAMRLAFADTNWYVADPQFTDLPIYPLLSKDYAAERRRLINPGRATLDQRRGSPVAGSTPSTSVSWTAMATPARSSTATTWGSAPASCRAAGASACRTGDTTSASTRRIPTRWRLANDRITRLFRVC